MAKKSGKILGSFLGLVTGGPIGMAIGMLVGHMYDRTPDLAKNAWTHLVDAYGDFGGNVQQANFTIGVIVLGAKMAKADGRVTRAEIEAFKRVFRVSDAQEDRVGRLFNTARTSASGYEPFAMQLAQTFQNNRTVLEEILGGLFVIAAADSAGLSPAEVQFLQRVAVIFGFDALTFGRIAVQAGVHLTGSQGGTNGQTKREEAPRSEIENSYAILGIQQTASAEQVKAAYRALIREFHPDKLVAQGLSPEFLVSANEKMKRINVAYDVVCKIKGIK